MQENVVRDTLVLKLYKPYFKVHDLATITFFM